MSSKVTTAMSKSASFSHSVKLNFDTKEVAKGMLFPLPDITNIYLSFYFSTQNKEYSTTTKIMRSRKKRKNNPTAKKLI